MAADLIEHAVEVAAAVDCCSAAVDVAVFAEPILTKNNKIFQKMPVTRLVLHQQVL